MISWLDYAIWIAGAVAALLVVGITVKNGEAKRYLAMNLFQLATVAMAAGEWIVLHRYGYTSVQYFYFYYHADSVVTVLLYLVIAGFYAKVYEEIRVSTTLRAATMLILAATAWVSFTIVESHKDHLTSRFAIELSRNLYFVGLVLTYILWMAYMRMPEHSRRLLQLISALGIYFSAYALGFVLQMRFHTWHFLRMIPPVLGTWLPASWAYTLWKVSESERICGPAMRGFATSETFLSEP
jgi:hypothetical protein